MAAAQATSSSSAFRAPKRQITQDTFNECVRENMEEFDMSEEDAIADAVTQFESQGVDLSTIVKSLVTAHPVLTALHALEEDEDGILNHLRTLEEQFRSPELGAGAKELAGRHNGIAILLQRLPACDPATAIVVLRALQSMVTSSKDNQNLVGEVGIATVYDTSLLSSHVATQNAALACLKMICARNEGNKKRLTTHGVIARLIVLFRERSASSINSTDVAELLRVLTIHDDADSMFSQAHDIVKQVVENDLIDLAVPHIRATMPHAASSTEAAAAAVAWMAVVKQLAVTEDHCRRLVAVGILDLVRILHEEERQQSRALLTHSLGLLRNLAAVDEYKTLLTTACMPSILQIMRAHAADASLQTMGCATIAAVCLRSPPNCDRVAELHGYKLVGLAMVSFPTNVVLLRQASLAIRNMVVRNEHLHPLVLEDVNVQAQLRRALPLRGCGDEAYAALRDLGADVPLASIGQSAANFNPVMESSNQLASAMRDNAHAPFGSD
ncbi:Aste57867_15918 [Aphanomyces stellatus]|uniref:Aste57867_15918 protein n=1 Tax=Aphanomyces stellatus TaxID=120398 RepID=A0A485L499_9STRA|nr:hypothetical protein As57867_015862 [Aphanomyces stellatus]VFT92704.1 Aste57867_15918 [Aphanomyces stellatus]